MFRKIWVLFMILSSLLYSSIDMKLSCVENRLEDISTWNGRGMTIKKLFYDKYHNSKEYIYGTPLKETVAKSTTFGSFQFGSEWFKSGGITHFHLGTDLVVGSSNKKIYSFTDGKVIQIHKDSGGWMYHIVIQHTLNPKIKYPVQYITAWQTLDGKEVILKDKSFYKKGSNNKLSKNTYIYPYKDKIEYKYPDKIPAKYLYLDYMHLSKPTLKVKDNVFQNKTLLGTTANLGVGKTDHLHLHTRYLNKKLDTGKSSSDLNYMYGGRTAYQIKDLKIKNNLLKKMVIKKIKGVSTEYINVDPLYLIYLKKNIIFNDTIKKPCANRKIEIDTNTVDVTLPDNGRTNNAITIVKNGQKFIKVWKIKNIGEIDIPKKSYLKCISSICKDKIFPIYNEIKIGKSGNLAVSFVADSNFNNKLVEFELYDAYHQKYDVSFKGFPSWKRLFFKILVKDNLTNEREHSSYSQYQDLLYPKLTKAKANSLIKKYLNIDVSNTSNYKRLDKDKVLTRFYASWLIFEASIQKNKSYVDNTVYGIQIREDGLTFSKNILTNVEELMYANEIKKNIIKTNAESYNYAQKFALGSFLFPIKRKDDNYYWSKEMRYISFESAVKRLKERLK